MLTENLRKELMEKIRKNPKEAIKIISKEPKILEILLNANKEAERERIEKIKYVNMTVQMEHRLQEKARQLNTTQGLLIGAGILWILSLLDD